MRVRAGCNNRILRGTWHPGQDAPEQFCLDDGNFEHGWRVIRFEIRNAYPLIPSEACMATLGLSQDVDRSWNFADANGIQIAWASCGSANAGQGGSVVTTSLCDYNSIVHQDLWLYGDGSGDDDYFNYYIEIEPVQMNKNEGLYVSAKNKSIGD